MSAARRQVPPPAGADGLAEALAARLEHPPKPASSPQKARPARPATPPPAPVAEIEDTALLARWRWQLGATARKAAATRAKADAALADWERLCADAEAAGVPPRLVVAAAADAGMYV